MNVLLFNVEETNIIAMYQRKNRLDTIKNLKYIAAFIDNEDMEWVLQSASDKLSNLTDEEFNGMRFILTV